MVFTSALVALDWVDIGGAAVAILHARVRLTLVLCEAAPIVGAVESGSRGIRSEGLSETKEGGWRKIIKRVVTSEICVVCHPGYRTF